VPNFVLDKLPILRTHAALREKNEQLEAMSAEMQGLREQLSEMTALKKAFEKSTKLLEAHKTPVVSAKDLKRIVKHERQNYREAAPFPNIVVDDFVDVRILRRVANEVAQMDRTGWHRTTTPRERKLSTEDDSVFGSFTRRVFAALNSSLFVTFLEELTGIEGLIGDPHLRGGGLHEIERGGLLGVHADFNFYKRLHLWRRLNVLIYLNAEWNEEWGGHLELWDGESKTCVKRIAPTFNRAVIFDTSSRSYHGHPHPLNCPDGQSRRSLALYYYTVDYPYPEDLTPHSTLFISDQPQ
jgi:Rps23 Pro-64 3,4-dihydroxylase Tpa1-like proline 4-hydroxylase